jgi:hypothetical protein
MSRDVGRSSDWTRGLTPEQVATIRRIRDQFNCGKVGAGTVGWTVYQIGTTIPALYAELRHYLFSGSVARWVIEKDGTVSRSNDLGARGRLLQEEW